MKDHLMCHFLMICPTLMMINSGLTGIEDWGFVIPLFFYFLCLPLCYFDGLLRIFNCWSCSYSLLVMNKYLCYLLLSLNILVFMKALPYLQFVWLPL
jgi:hypothetical protein